MFTWRDLIDMGLRQKGYWLRQADATRRQMTASIAHGVGMGIAMAFSEEGQTALDGLELNKTIEEVKKQESESTWELMKLFGGGKGV